MKILIRVVVFRFMVGSNFINLLLGEDIIGWDAFAVFDL